MCRMSCDKMDSNSASTARLDVVINDKAGPAWVDIKSSPDVAETREATVLGQGSESLNSCMTGRNLGHENVTSRHTRGFNRDSRCQ